MSLASRSARRVLIGVMPLVVALAVPATAAERAKGAPALFPGGALAYAELNGLGAKLKELRASELLTAVLASPQYGRYEESADYRKLQAVMLIAERQLGRDPWTLAEQLLGGSLAIAIYPKEGDRTFDVLAILRTSEPDALADLRRRLDPLLVLAADGIQMTETLEGVETLTFPNDAAVLAWKDDWLVVATSDSLVDGAMRRLSESADEDRVDGLAADAPYQAMARAIDWDLPASDAGTQRVLRVYVDMALAKKASGGRLGPEKLDNPLGSLLFGDVARLLGTSPFAAATVDVTSHGASLMAAVAREAEGVPEAYLAFAPREGPGAAPPPRVPDLLGGFTMYRDFAQWYAHREDLLQEQILPGFDKFETGLANVLPGRDFGEDVLPLFGKRITFVAAPQDYAHLDGEPGVKLPGMAMIVELARPDEAAAILQLFFQTIAALANLQAGQQGRQPWVVTSDAYHDVQISYAQYLEKPSGDDLAIAFNFLPAAARVGDRFILSSSLSLCQRLIDGMEQGNDDDGDRPPRTTLAELHFDSVAKMLDSNGDFLRGRLVQDGRTVDEAEAEFEAVLDLMRRFESFQAQTESAPRVFRIRLTGTWK